MNILQKLANQKFGPNDSYIASTIAHPLLAANKFANYVDDTVKYAMNPDIPDVLKTQATMELAGLMQTGGLPFAPKGAGTLGTIKMPSDDIIAAATAAQRKGMSIQNLWKNFKVYPWQDMSGNNIFLSEISDTNSKLIGNIGKRQKMLPDVISHSKLFKQNPELLSYLVNRSEYGPSFAQYDDIINMPLKKSKDDLSLLLHEITHAQQDLNKLPLGDATHKINDNEFINELLRRLQKYPDRQNNLRNNPSNELYQSAAGEAQARMTQERFKMSEQQLLNESPLVTLVKMKFNPKSLAWKYYEY